MQYIEDIKNTYQDYKLYPAFYIPLYLYDYALYYNCAIKFAINKIEKVHDKLFPQRG